ncbi:hypothetical protein ACFYW1_32400 [Streptomyces sp. NPDC002669]
MRGPTAEQARQRAGAYGLAQGRAGAYGHKKIALDPAESSAIE